MKRFYSDIRDGGQFMRDDEGVERHIKGACQEATTALRDSPRIGWKQAASSHHGT
ncbi:DUF6894 family protein [Bradyrhizobium yuanmingense]|uniref:DUF6894 family protein n=1 Tax=Bradyrhizobium yuanmingense TaxID=108015 RepID=UPI003B967C13